MPVGGLCMLLGMLALLTAPAGCLLDHGLHVKISCSADPSASCHVAAVPGDDQPAESPLEDARREQRDDPGDSGAVTLGFLGAYGQTHVVLGALPLAVRSVNEDPTLLPGRQLQYLAADIGTNPSESGLRRRDSSLAALALRVMTVMRDRGAVAFIGPDDTCGAEALVATAWNLPVISYNCADAHMSDKRVYHTFARTLPPASKVSKSVVALLRAFDWGSFVVVAGKQPAWSTGVKDAIEDLARTHGIAISDICEFSDYIPRHIEEMEAIVEKTYETTRVYVFVGEHVALVDFVMVLHRRGLLEKGEYVVISVDDEIYDPESKHKIVQREYLDPFLRNGTASSAEDAAVGFRSVLKLTPGHPRNPKYKNISAEIKKLSTGPPFCVPYHPSIFGSISVPIHAAHLYDAVMIYARALTEILEDGVDPRNGTAVLQHIRGRAYQSVQGFDVLIDDNGDAEGNFSVVAALPDAKTGISMQPVGYFVYSHTNDTEAMQTALPEFRYFDDSRKIQWVSGSAPRGQPQCGFHGERCTSRADWRLSLPVAAVAVLLAVAAAFALKHYRYEQKLACLLWKVDSRDITLIPSGSDTANKSMVCRRSVLRPSAPGSVAEATAGALDADGGDPRVLAHTHVGLYKGNIVAVKYVHKRSLDLTRSIRKELKQIREVRHENLIPFMGACVDQGALCILTAYCARGSLEDVLANKDLHLDNMFVSSLVADILKGMIYLHDSDIVSHGNLRSSNCLVDSRWVLQISDFGLHEFKAGQMEPDAVRRELRRCLWRAPELLRASGAACIGHHHPGRGTQKGDVYSFAILLYEIIGRAGPWGSTTLSDQEIVERVAAPPPPGQPPFRPDVRTLAALEAEQAQQGTADYVVRCVEACWSEDPEQRPDIRLVRVKLKEMQAGLKPNIFDNMLSIMEKYAYNLEGLVQERTNQLTEEKKKTEALLHRMLPKTVAEALKRGDPVEAESFDCVTIYFSDIVGFTELSAESTPLQVVDLLNDLYTCCDSIISHYDVYKVETIGDAYMVASGLPVRNAGRHAGEIASMALRILSRIRRFEVRHRKGEAVQLRIGIHSGHCVAGVVGLAMPRYCLFGDTVNTASRMESSGLPHRIHISEATHALLQRLGGYHCEERGVIPIKGKGAMRTFWLLSEDPARRIARFMKFFHTGLSTEGLSETPDLLR
ncbi:guanylate cyclase 32E, partial [Thrips palmi]|uniref:Guanylate cyclase n=1 Tax=Thrips palmi TaxID=161013 RepID=A0A6P8Z840_THRPL